MEERPLTGEEENRLREILARSQGEPGALLPVLLKAQEACGALSLAALEVIAAGLALPLATVVGTADFHALRGDEHRGRYVIRVCRSGPCQVNGAGATLQALEKALGIRAGETTADARFTLEALDCLGYCDRAPAVMVNDEVYGPVPAAEVPALLARFA
jgi:NADH:ubiquinone oxidoreductase subunit E